MEKIAQYKEAIYKKADAIALNRGAVIGAGLGTGLGAVSRYRSTDGMDSKVKRAGKVLLGGLQGGLAGLYLGSLANPSMRAYEKSLMRDHKGNIGKKTKADLKAINDVIREAWKR